MALFSIFHWLIVFAIGWAVFIPLMKVLGNWRARPKPDGRMICPACGTRSNPVSITRGSIGIEIVLWLLFLVPGILYSLWRLSTRLPGCPACRHTGMIPVDTPRGQQLLKNNI